MKINNRFKTLAIAALAALGSLAPAFGQDGGKQDRVSRDVQRDMEKQLRSIGPTIEKAMKQLNGSLSMLKFLGDVDVPAVDSEVPSQHVHTKAVHVHVSSIHIHIPTMHVTKDGKRVKLKAIDVNIPEIKVDVPGVDMDIPTVHVHVPKVHVHVNRDSGDSEN